VSPYELLESGSPWLGDVPSHWRVSRFGYEARVNEGQVDPREEPWSSMTLVAPNHIESGTGRIVGRGTAAEQGADSGKYLAKAGQILYSKIRPALNKVTIAVEDCLWSADMYAMSFRPTSTHRYALYYMLARPFHSFATVTSTRVKMPKINREELAAAAWLVPPIEEQRAIADFLDRETAQIDALVAKQNEFIALLGERKKAELDSIFQPGAPNRRTQLGRLLSGKPTYGVLVPRYVEGANSAPFVRVGDLLRLEPGMGLPRISDSQSEEYRRTRLVGGELLLGVVGRMGVVAVAPEWLGGANVARAVAVLRPVNSSWERLLHAWLSSDRFLRQADAATSGDSVQPTLGMNDLAHFEINWPSDLAAAESSVRRLERVDALIAKAQEHIAFAKERRAALIAAAVTGQIDVRTARIAA